MSQPRVFMPDQQTPAQKGEHWREGDVFAVQHGPDPDNLFFFRGGDSRCRQCAPEPEKILVDNGHELFRDEIEQFLSREHTRLSRQLERTTAAICRSTKKPSQPKAPEKA